MQAVMMYEHGGPEVLRLEERPTPQPGPGEALVQVAAAGVNFIDIYRRSGWYKLTLPCGLGSEGAGTVLQAGAGVTALAPGDRVAWMAGADSYATHAVLPADKLAPVPEKVTLEQAAATILQGITADVLTSRTYSLKPGDRCLVHAAAGGVGRLLCQVARMRGAEVIGTVSSDSKALAARKAGANEVIIYTKTDFEPEVRRITNGKGVDVVYDSVGKDTFDKSLACLAPMGTMVLYGQSSGFVPPLDIQRLAGSSLFLTRPVVFHYVKERADLLRHAAEVLSWVAEGSLKLHIDRKFSLAEAAQAHRALAGRQTMGKLLIIP